MINNSAPDGNASDNDRESSLPTEKQAIHDDNRSFTGYHLPNHWETTEKPVIDGIRVFGAKILASESTFRPWQNRSSSSNGSELTLGKKRNRDAIAEAITHRCVDPKPHRKACAFAPEIFPASPVYHLVEPDHIQMLRRLSPAELNKQAVELEKRSMQLSVEEAREIQRTEALHILGTASNDRL